MHRARKGSNSIIILTSALDRGKGSASVLCSSMPRSPWYILNKRLGWMEYNLFFLIFQFVSYLSTAQYIYPWIQYRKKFTYYIQFHGCMHIYCVNQSNSFLQVLVNNKMSLWTSQPYSEVHKSAISVRSDHLVKTHKAARKMTTVTVYSTC